MLTNKPTLCFLFKHSGFAESCSTSQDSWKPLEQRPWPLGRRRRVTYIPPALLAPSQSPIEDRTGQNRARPGEWKKRRLLWPRLLKRRSPEEWCWQCGKMCFSLKHGYTHIHTSTHFIHKVEMGVHILAADKVDHSDTVLWTITQTTLLTLLHTCFWRILIRGSLYEQESRFCKYMSLYPL